MEYNTSELLNFIQSKLSNVTQYDLYSDYLSINGCISQGVSKTVFYFEEYDSIVFKIAFGCGNKITEKDLLNEKTRYSKAKDCGVEKFFAKNIYIGNISIKKKEFHYDSCSIPVYIQKYIPELLNEKIEFNEDYNEASEKEKLESIFSKEELLCCTNYLADAGLDYDETFYVLSYLSIIEEKETIITLIDFIRNEELCDLHDENMGFFENQLVILDYSL